MPYKKPLNEGGILSAIKNCERDYASDFTLAGGITQNFPSIIRKNILYSHSKFEGGELDDNGYKKYFYTVSNALCDNATKNIDIDIANINLSSKQIKNRIKVLILNDLLFQYMERNN